MTVNFSSNPQVGQTGTLGNEVAIQNRRRAGVAAECGEDISLFGYLVTGGIDENQVLNRMEKSIGYESNSLSWAKSVSDASNYDNVLFQASDGNYLDVEFDRNRYTVQSERSLTESFGFDWSNGKPYDVMTMNQSGITFYEFRASGLGDGVQNGFCISDKMDNVKWGTTRYIQQEIDPYLWSSGPTSYEGLVAYNYLGLLQGTAGQFMSEAEISGLSANTNYSDWATSFADYVYSRLLLN